MGMAYKHGACEIPLRDSAVGSGEGVRDLMRAVLLDAIMCLRGRGKPGKDRERLARDARSWFLSTVRSGPFSFESICDVLGISTSYLRTLLLRPVVAPTGRPSADAVAVEAMLRRLSLLRMRGNQTTRIRAKRKYPRRKNNDL